MVKLRRVAQFWRTLSIPIVIAICVTLIALDWPLGYARQVYLNHPLMTGVLGSLIPIAIGATLVKAYIDHRENARWRVASRVAYNSLLRAPLAQRRMMWFLLCGGRIIEDRDFGLDAKHASKVRRLLRRHHFKQLSEASSFTEGRPNLEARLARLITDIDWQIVSYEVLRSTSHGFRAVIARWAPLLSSSPDGQRVLVELAQQEKELTGLYIRLVPASRLNEPLSSAARSCFASAWRVAFSNSVVLCEYLARRGEEYPEGERRVDRYLLNAEQMQRLLRLETDGHIVARLYRDDSR